jgi:phosphoribosylformylglycinamidine synthase
MYLPIAHAEGKFVPRDAVVRDQLAAAGQLALRYRPLDDGACTPLDAALPFPDNPNGSVLNVAGVCDPTGRVLGLMPHPERHIDRTQHPRWTRGEGSEQGDGLKMFRNAVGHFA